jgi:alpha-tubulin suppressor-like RCC1 family protein
MRKSFTGAFAFIFIVAFTCGCSAENQVRETPVKPPPGPGSANPTSAPASTAVRHWGSFFGGREGNFNFTASPSTMALPGPVAEVGTSNSTQYALLADGRVYAWGLGTQGQLGDGSERNSFTTPVRVRFPAGVKIAYLPTDAMPYDTGLAVDSQGHAWGWGRNRGGELCQGRGRIYTTPVRVPLPAAVTTLAGASNHALYDSGGTVYACGQNVAGDLGDGSMRSSATPVKVARLAGTHVTKLVASFANSGALLADGEYLDWGYDANGQLGSGRFGHPSDVPVRVNLPHPVTQVAQGGSLWNNGQTVVLLSDGSLWSWGAGRFFQLGNRVSGARAVPVRFRAPAGVIFHHLATGSATSYAISADGHVYAWGASHLGQLGNGRTGAARVPVVVASGATGISSTANNVAITVLPPS